MSVTSLTTTEAVERRLRSGVTDWRSWALEGALLLALLLEQNRDRIEDALGPAAFHAAMLTGRLIGAGVAGSLGAASTLVAGASMGLGGMAVALFVASPGAAIAGMAVAALGLSFVVPVIVSVAAARAGGHAGRAASYVLSLGYAGFLVGPSLIGVLGEMAGLRVALAVIPAAAAIVLMMSPVAAERRTT